jgi:hypothetical protein
LSVHCFPESHSYYQRTQDRRCFHQEFQRLPGLTLMLQPSLVALAPFWCGQTSAAHDHGTHAFSTTPDSGGTMPDRGRTARAAWRCWIPGHGARRVRGRREAAGAREGSRWMHCCMLGWCAGCTGFSTADSPCKSREPMMRASDPDHMTLRRTGGRGVCGVSKKSSGSTLPHRRRSARVAGPAVGLRRRCPFGTPTPSTPTSRRLTCGDPSMCPTACEMLGACDCRLGGHVESPCVTHGLC